MEDERVRDLLERVTNFKWEGPRPSEELAECQRRKERREQDFLSQTKGLPFTEIKRHREIFEASKDHGELEAELRRLGDIHVASTQFKHYRKLLREFQRTLRRDFPEWHYSEGSRVNHFVGGVGGGETTIQPELRSVWELASSGDAQKAERKLRKMSEHFMLKAKRLLATTDLWFNPETRKKESVPHRPRPKEAAILRQMAETLEWLQGRLRSLKVCENPKCSSGRRYFFKVYNNDRYCSTRCTTIAKALRQAKRDAESQKQQRPPAFTEEHRRKMSIAQQERWERYREKTGKPKYGKS